MRARWRSRHRILARDRQGDRRADGRARGPRWRSRRAQAGPCEEVAAALNAKHGAGTAIAAPANIASKDELAKSGRRDPQGVRPGLTSALCNAASNPYYGPLAGISDDQFRKILDNNIISNHWLIGMVAPEMRERRDGAVIIVSSIGGLRGNAIIGAYNISKAADFQLARNLAHEFGPDNVRVNCIAPGLIKTDFAKALWDDPGHAGARDQGRAAAPDRRARRDRRRGRLPRPRRPAAS
ncbi:SDR family NAD(P)-dependent oxidoreductase [Caulobacter segnis]